MSFRVVFAAALLVGVVACASSRPSGPGGVDAADDATGGDGSAGDDASEMDGAGGGDGGGPDGAGGGDGGGPDAMAVDAAVDAVVDANTCPTQPCDLHAQCGCAPPLTCDIDFTDLVGTSCRAVNVPGTETSTCSTFSECAAGYVCVGGRCRRYCDMESDCIPPRGACAIQITNGAMPPQPIPGATTCSANCDPINSAAGGCPAGMKCGFFEGIAMRDIVDCTTPGAGAHGATCASDSQCSSNTYCTTYNALQRCRRVCNRTTGGSECAVQPGTTCVGFTTPLMIGGTEYGVCAP